jgi:hypothetical protein
MHDTELNELKKQISVLRKELEKLYTDPDASSEETLKVSRELDKLLFTYQKLSSEREL